MFEYEEEDITFDIGSGTPHEIARELRQIAKEITNKRNVYTQDTATRLAVIADYLADNFEQHEKLRTAIQDIGTNVIKIDKKLQENGTNAGCKW